MSPESNPYDEYYFQHGCGRPYQRDDEWLQFFGGIADRIVSDVQPKTVLDAGCAKGFLVEGLRNLGVEAYGVDISDFAIANVDAGIRDYCWQGSIVEPFPRSYDLIVSIEVFEHMDPQDAETAAQNLCQHTDDIIFSSTPFDYKEATHFNVRPPEYWSELLAKQGFFRDVDFDATFITDWAVRYRKVDAPLHRHVRNYERKYWLLWKENNDLRALVNDMREEIVSLDRRLNSPGEDSSDTVANAGDANEQLSSP